MDQIQTIMGVVAACLLIFSVILAAFFHKAYHTYHGDLPKAFRIFIATVVVVGIIFAVFWGYLKFTNLEEVTLWLKC